MISRMTNFIARDFSPELEVMYRPAVEPKLIIPPESQIDREAIKCKYGPEKRTFL